MNSIQSRLNTLSSDLNEKLNPKLKKLIQFIHENNFKVGIIGGFCRDYLLTGEISEDVDIEIRSFGNTTIHELYKSLEQRYENTELLKFNILRVKIDSIEVELSEPRIEHFNDNKGHSNFTAEFIKDLEYIKGFKRRDFTINAIMFRYDNYNWDIKDPCNGIVDLENRKLKIINQEDFKKDPVRFLRAIRFHLKYDLELDIDLKELLISFPFENISSHYYKSEITKSQKPLKALDLIYNTNLKNDILDEFDELFDGELEKHIKCNPIIDIHERQKYLSMMGYSQKNLIPNAKKIDPVVDFEDNKDYILRVLEVIEKLHLNDKYTSLVLDRVFLNFDLTKYKNYLKINYKLTDLDKKQDPKEYKWIILKNKLMMS